MRFTIPAQISVFQCLLKSPSRPCQFQVYPRKLFWLRHTWHGCQNLGTAYEFSTRVDVRVRFTMVASVSSNTSFGSTFIASVSIFPPRNIFGNCPCSMKPYSSQILRISTSNWHRAQLAVVDKPYLQGTQRLPLTSQLLCV